MSLFLFICSSSFFFSAYVFIVSVLNMLTIVSPGSTNIYQLLPKFRPACSTKFAKFDISNGQLSLC